MTFKKGDYALSDSKAILLCISDLSLNGKTIKVECIKAANNTISAKVGVQFNKSVSLMTPYQYNGAWNSSQHTTPTKNPFEVEIAKQTSESEEADPFGLVKQRKELKRFILGE